MITLEQIKKAHHKAQEINGEIFVNQQGYKEIKDILQQETEKQQKDFEERVWNMYNEYGIERMFMNIAIGSVNVRVDRFIQEGIYVIANMDFDSIMKPTICSIDFKEQKKTRMLIFKIE